MAKWLIFPDPLHAHCTLTPDDTGIPIGGVPDTHISGRPGQSFTLPDGLTDQHGVQLVIAAEGFDTIIQRGVMHLLGGVFTAMDDFHLMPEKVCPPCPPAPAPPSDPLGIIRAVQDLGHFNLAGVAGCGDFTEACCTILHNRLSAGYGHIKKTPPQNQYNGHAVDAIMLLTNTPGGAAGIYDIIFDSVSPNAKPVFNFSGPPDPALWTYPA